MLNQTSPFSEENVIEVPVTEELLPLLEGEELPIEQRIDIVAKLRIIRYYNGEMKRLAEEWKDLKAEWDKWYAKRLLHCSQRIDVHEQNIANFMRNNNLQNCPTPEGTPYFKPVTHFKYPTEKEVVAFMEANAPELLKVEKSITKDDLKKYIHKTGNAPPGYEETTEQMMYIKEPNK